MGGAGGRGGSVANTTSSVTSTDNHTSTSFATTTSSLSALSHLQLPMRKSSQPPLEAQHRQQKGQEKQQLSTSQDHGDEKDDNHLEMTLLHSLIAELSLQQADASAIMSQIRGLLVEDPDTTHAFHKRVFPRELAARLHFQGQKALHLAVQNFVRKEIAEVIDLLLDVYPEAASHRNKQGLLPIEVLLSELLQQSPNRREIRAQTLYFKNGAILRLLNAYPEAASRCTNAENQTLLHVVATNAANYSVKVFDALQMANPSAALRLDSSGKTPVHWLIDTSLLDALKTAAWDPEPQLETIEKIKVLLRPAPNTLRAAGKDSNGDDPAMTITAAIVLDLERRTPLLAALLQLRHTPCPRELAATLLKACPAAASIRGTDGRLPLAVVMTRAPALATSVLRELIMANPSAVLEKLYPEPDATILRRFLSCGSRHLMEELMPIETLEAMVKAHPNPDVDGTRDSLLHLAARNSVRCSLDILDVIQRANPSATVSTNSKGETPLHCLFRVAPHGDGRFHERMMVLLRTNNPDSDDDLDLSDNEDGGSSATTQSAVITSPAAVSDQEGMTPLHALLVEHKSCSQEFVLSLLEAWPEAARIRDKRGRLPLTVAAAQAQRPIAYLEKLADANPSALSSTDATDSTILHYLLDSPFDLDSLEYVLKAYPEAVTRLNRAGVTPLQNALSTGSGSAHRELAEVVQLITDKQPNSVTTKDGLGKSTLHNAVLDMVPANVIEILLKVDPEAAAKVWEGDQTTPLSNAVRFHDSAEICTLLLEHCPYSARALLDDNTTALHHVQSAATMKALLEAWPEGLLHKSRRMGRTPMHYWMANDVFRSHREDAANAPLLYVKQRAKNHFSKVIMETDNLGLTPLHYAFGNYDDESYLAFRIGTALENPDVILLLQSFPEVLFMRVTKKRKLGQGGGSLKTMDQEFNSASECEDEDDEGGENAGDFHDVDDAYGNVDDECAAFDAIMGRSIVERLCGSDDGLKALEHLFKKLCASYDDVVFNGCSQGFISKTTSFVTVDESAKSEAKEQGRDGFAAWFLHNACEHASCQSEMVPLIRQCYNRDASCVCSPFASGGLALHMACRQSNCCVEVVKELTELYGAALTTKDRAGRVPFHLACQNDASVHVLYHLLRSAPDVVF